MNDIDAKWQRLRTSTEGWLVRQPGWSWSQCFLAAVYEEKWIYGDSRLSGTPVGILGSTADGSTSYTPPEHQASRHNADRGASKC